MTATHPSTFKYSFHAITSVYEVADPFHQLLSWPLIYHANDLEVDTLLKPIQRVKDSNINGLHSIHSRTTPFPDKLRTLHCDLIEILSGCR